jgi:hypothetical protein
LGDAKSAAQQPESAMSGNSSEYLHVRKIMEMGYCRTLYRLSDQCSVDGPFSARLRSQIVHLARCSEKQSHFLQREPWRAYDHHSSRKGRLQALAWS